jgi:hypothetical protein
MGRLILAFKLFFKVLFDKALADRAAGLFAPAAPEPARPAPISTIAAKPASTRSDALTLLSVLQREARLIDFLKEEISGYDDAQIGAAIRDVHRDAAAVLERLFALRPLIEQPEGSDIALPATVDGSRLKLVGNLSAQTPPRGRLQHAGWQATKTELPQFTGAPEAAKIIAPAEIEV